MSEVIITINGKPFLGVESGNNRGLTESSIFVSNQAKTLAPVDKGQLKNSIMYKLANGGNAGFNDSGGEPAPAKISLTPEKGSAYVGSNLAHAIYQEFGTRLLNAQPFLRPAGELLNVNIVAPVMESEMKKHLKIGKKVITFSNAKVS